MAETETAAKAKKHKGSKIKKWKRVAKGAGKACKVEGCKRPYRAKGYCFFHYEHWRSGELPKARYTPCTAEKCTKKPFKDRLCQTHYNEKIGKKEGATPAAPAAA